ncbi:MAG: CDP-alcohol phosphatidyltransferase family protein [Clostridia bacterium]|nr:CDP-alcohol phosphatidyltransferase family protein [Clostridia bacterium]
MIGFYDYTMLLTFCSLVSASTGIVISLLGQAHPFIGMFFLLFSGLCDAFDGKVARLKKNRTETECKFGIQIDSLSDVVAFGILPTCIGAALVHRSEIFEFEKSGWGLGFSILCYAIMGIYALTAMIRLAYFNVTEEERQKVETGTRKYYLGLPVTSASLIFPAVLLVQYICDKFFNVDITLVYFAVMLLTAIAFVAKFQLKKPGLRAILVMVAIGAVEAAIMILALLATK